MAYHAVLIPSMIAAMNIDSLNRSVISACPVDNGNVLTMGAEYTSGSLTEVFAVEKVVTTASGPGIWMAYSGDEIVLTASKYKGIDPDPRNFYNEAGYVFSAFKPQVGDIITITAAGFSGSSPTTVGVYANPVPNANTLLWSTSASTAGLLFKYIGTTYISLATGGIDSQRVAAYKLECVQI
jgi:hypothetical protein